MDESGCPGSAGPGFEARAHARKKCAPQPEVGSEQGGAGESQRGVRVRRLKRQVASGTYQVDALQVALALQAVARRKPPA